MVVFQVYQISDECSPGSDPIVEVFTFSTEEKRSEFIKDWIEEKESMRFEKSDDLLTYYGDSRVHKLECSEQQVDCVYYGGRIYKQY